MDVIDNKYLNRYIAKLEELKKGKQCASGKEIIKAVIESRKNLVREVASLVAKDVVAKAEKLKAQLEDDNDFRKLNFVPFVEIVKYFNMFLEKGAVDCEEVKKKSELVKFDIEIRAVVDKKSTLLDTESYLEKSLRFFEVKKEEYYKFKNTLKKCGLDKNYEDIFHY